MWFFRGSGVTLCDWCRIYPFYLPPRPQSVQEESRTGCYLGRGGTLSLLGNQLHYLSKTLEMLSRYGGYDGYLTSRVDLEEYDITVITYRRRPAPLPAYVIYHKKTTNKSEIARWVACGPRPTTLRTTSTLTWRIRTYLPDSGYTEYIPVSNSTRQVCK